MFAMLFLAVHGVFSFQTGTTADIDIGSLSGLAPTRSRGILDQVILPGLAYSIIVYAVFVSFRQIAPLVTHMKTMMVLTSLTILSTLWSQDPLRSAYSGVFYLLGTLFAFYLVLRFTDSQVLDLFILLGLLACVLGITIVIVAPQIGITASQGRTAGAWRGIFVDRTTAGKCLTFLLSPALVFGYRKLTVWRASYIVLLLGSIVMARAVSALVVLVLYTSFMLLLHHLRRMERKNVVALCLVGVAGLVAAAGIIYPYLGDIAALFGRDLTLTNRTDIWANLMPSIAKHPMLGYGFYAFWLGLTGESAQVVLATHWIFGYAHNGFLEIILQLGLVGLALFVLTFIHALKDAWVCLTTGERSIAIDWYIGLLVLTILYNIDEETVLWPTDLLSVLYVLACCGLSIAGRRAKASAKRKTLTVFGVPDNS